MPNLVLNLLPIDIADLPGPAHGGDRVRAGLIVIKESL
jgi:hypothetical protein